MIIIKRAQNGPLDIFENKKTGTMISSYFDNGFSNGFLYRCVKDEQGCLIPLDKRRIHDRIIWTGIINPSCLYRKPIYLRMMRKSIVNAFSPHIFPTRWESWGIKLVTQINLVHFNPSHLPTAPQLSVFCMTYVN